MDGGRSGRCGTSAVSRAVKVKCQGLESVTTPHLRTEVACATVIGDSSTGVMLHLAQVIAVLLIVLSIVHLLTAYVGTFSV